MSLKARTSLLLAAVLALVESAEDLQARGAIRPEHDQKFASHRVALEQARDAAQALDNDAESETPASPDAAALADLAAKVGHVGDVLELHSTLLDRLADLAEAKA